MKLILCEKPSVARQIAIGLEKMLKVKQQKSDGSITVGPYSVTWAFGHLVQNDIPSTFGSFSNFPVKPETWKYVPSPDSGARAQLKAIGTLVKSATEIIVATDPGREGELIARLILDHVTKKKLPMQRMWTSESLEDPNVVIKAMNALKPGINYDSLYSEALARQHADGLVGINLSRALKTMISDGQSWSIGRVQTPVLCILAERELEIKNFVPVPYWTLRAEFSKNSDSYEGRYLKPKTQASSASEEDDEDSDDSAESSSESGAKLSKAEIDLILAKMSIGAPGKIISVSSKKKSEPPPLLHSITSLQIEANKRFSMKPMEAGKHLQDLYDAGYVSYPRTESKHLGTGNVALVQEVLNKIGRADLVNKVSGTNKRVFDDSKLTDHHALIPLKSGASLSGKQQQIYAIIEKSFLAAFYPYAESETFEIITETSGIQFLTTGVQDIKLGWKDVYGFKAKSFSFELKPETDVTVKSILPEAKETIPPSRYTEGSLLRIMEKAHRLLPKSEAKLRKIMQTKENSGLGTGATRAGILQKLEKAQYYHMDGKYIVPEDRAILLYQKLHGVSKVADPIMTAQWEEELGSIRQKTITYEKFIDDIWSLVLSEVSAFKGIKLNELSVNSGTVCPGCGGNELQFEFIKATCSCGFTVWRKFCGVLLPEDKFRELLQPGGKVYVSGMTSKSGSKFSAWVSVMKSGKLEFDFTTSPPPTQSSSKAKNPRRTASVPKTAKTATKPKAKTSKSTSGKTSKDSSSLLSKF